MKLDSWGKLPACQPNEPEGRRWQASSLPHGVILRLNVVKLQFDVRDFVSGHFQEYRVVDDFERGNRAAAEIALSGARRRAEAVDLQGPMPALSLVEPQREPKAAFGSGAARGVRY